MGIVVIVSSSRELQATTTFAPIVFEIQASYLPQGCLLS
jgi:hypothetical protein